MISRIPLTPPIIQSLDTTEHRPLFSVMIPAYNCISYLRKTLKSVLVQDLGPGEMQIEVVDDCSIDGNIALLVEEIGKGRISYYRQLENRGSLRNFETCINRANGYYVHLLHGDDAVKPGFYNEIKILFERYPLAAMAFTNYNTMDEKSNEVPAKIRISAQSGILKNWLYAIASMQRIQPPAVVVKREVYEKLGSFYGVTYGEDWEMWVRIAANYHVVYSPECLATYREGHNTSVTTIAYLTGQNFKDIVKVIDAIQQYLPVKKRKVLNQLANKNWSASFAKSSYLLLKKNGHLKLAVNLIIGALKLDINKRSIYWLVRCCIERIKLLFS